MVSMFNTKSTNSKGIPQMEPYLIYFLVEVNCGINDFNCSLGNMDCIPWPWICDGDEDCTDGSDESNRTCGLCF